jgi:hypothetical protein
MSDYRGSPSRAHEHLARYWDAITGGHPADPLGLDSELAAAIQSFHRLAAEDDTQRPDPRFVHDLLEELMATATSVTPGFVWQLDAPGQSLNSRPWSAHASPPLQPRRGSWTGGTLATAALVLLTLIGSLLAIGSHRFRVEEDAQLVVPALVGTPEASPVPVAPAHLLTLNVTGLSCTGSCVQLIHSGFAPGGFTQETSAGPDSELFYVESGTITAKLLKGDHPAVNLGSGLEAAPQAATPSPAGEVMIAAGQAGWITPGTTIEVRNDSDAPASVIWLIEGADTDRTQGLSWDALGPNASGDVPPSPLLITLDRRTLAPNAAITLAPAPAITTAGAVGPLAGTLASSTDGYRNIGKTPFDIYVLTVEPREASTTASIATLETATPAEATPAAARLELQGVVEDMHPGSTWTGIARDFLEPGAEVALQDGKRNDSAISSTFLLIEAGRLEVRAGGPVAVQRRGDGNQTTAAANTTVTLEAGDGAVIAPGVAIDLRNPGPDPAVAINADLTPIGDGPSAAGYRFDILANQYNLPAPAVMTLHQTTLAPSEVLPDPTGGAVQLAAPTSSTGLLVHTSDGYRNAGQSPLDIYVLTITPKVTLGTNAATPAGPAAP